jgi:hypothetical protein
MTAAGAKQATGILVWRVEKSGRFIECAMHVGAGGVNVRIRREDDVSVEHTFQEIDQAEAHGRELLCDLSANGWHVA